MKRLLILAITLFSTLYTANATHLMGGEITVQDLGNGTHMVTLIAYRDTVGIQMTSTVELEFRHPLGHYMQKFVPQDSIISGNLLPMYPYGVEIYLFIDTVTFPIAGDWTISWTHCCRNGAIQNLSNPLSESMRLQTKINVDTASVNSSPFFLVPAAIFLPLNTPWQYNPLPFDPDSDSLHWSLEQPLDDINKYCAGYTAPSSDPNNTFSLDPVTGTISWTANQLGNFVASILVEQYRNGVLVGEVRRDMQFIVVNPSLGFPLWANLSTLPKDLNNNYSFDLREGQGFKLEMIAAHTFSSRKVFMDAYSEIFRIPQNNASFTTSTIANTNKLMGTFTWQPTKADIRKQPYLVVFRASDKYFTDDKSIKLNVMATVGTPELNSENKFSLYPNPAENMVHVDFTGATAQTVSLDVYTLNGQKVIAEMNLEAINGRNIFVLNTADWNPGSYLIRITDSNGINHNKMLMVK